ncbi:hypothetical protein BCA37_00170 [Mycobacterium sp. djl-10]|nr:hypothetical protein BCA37_00170 [Mycobacterium sp. djl-10]
MPIGDRGGARLAELLTDPQRAERVAQIRHQMHAEDNAYSRTLALVRQAANQTHIELARQLGIGLEALTEIERQSDLLLSTLSGHLAAIGTHGRIVLTVGESDVEFELGALARS